MERMTREQLETFNHSTEVLFIIFYYFLFFGFSLSVSVSIFFRFSYRFHVQEIWPDRRRHKFREVAIMTHFAIPYIIKINIKKTADVWGRRTIDRSIDRPALLTINLYIRRFVVVVVVGRSRFYFIRIPPEVVEGSKSLEGTTTVGGGWLTAAAIAWFCRCATSTGRAAVASYTTNSRRQGIVYTWTLDQSPSG